MILTWTQTAFAALPLSVTVISWVSNYIPAFRAGSNKSKIFVCIQKTHTKINVTPSLRLGVGLFNSLTMTYFHTGTRTIIGAKSFHCPVRDGKEWYQLAMVIRHNCLTKCSHEHFVEFIEQISFY